jgi:hypothetical protein
MNKIYMHECGIPCMHALVKWLESDPVFDAMGTLIAVTGILAFASLLMYTCGFLT